MRSIAHEVAALPLSEGDIDLTQRVPAHLTDERTEVGQVGLALNSMLDNVEGGDLTLGSPSASQHVDIGG